MTPRKIEILGLVHPLRFNAQAMAHTIGSDKKNGLITTSQQSGFTEGPECFKNVTKPAQAEDEKSCMSAVC
jgi:hypothetical protein